MAFQIDDIQESFEDAQQVGEVRRNLIEAVFGSGGWRVFRRGAKRAITIRREMRAVLAAHERFLSSYDIQRRLIPRGVQVPVTVVQDALAVLWRQGALDRAGIRGKRTYALRGRTSVDDHC